MTVPDDCAISYTVNGENDIELHFGSDRVGLDMVLSPTAALRLAEVAGAVTPG